MREFELIKKYFSKLSKSNKSSLNLNDDVFFDKNRSLVISIDTYNEGVHFLNFKRPDLVIKKILRSSISDLICKGVSPKYYFISGSGNKKTFTNKNLSKISNSLKHEQNKYGIFLCGGDTTFSNKLSFSITSVGFSKKIIFRNKAKLNDDIYVTGNLGDSFVGLKILQNKISSTKIIENYFVKKYFEPDIQIKLTTALLRFANSSIDVSDGLIDDLEKMINKQRLSYKIYEEKIPISKNLNSFLKKNKLRKSNFISNGDDYQILFTAGVDKSRIILRTSRKLGIKITKIGKITSNKKKSAIMSKKGQHLLVKSHGYEHQF
ncbi:thiamine-phosphate kinase [Candidatus Pelagibacter bacterium nBUS_27]|uniref:thiamine-phosphate kinase n=1 Tax=Candidatus Pelagibacter bacterium nBUS_27 TaxID=3374188 RepID=UPI003EC0D9BC|tara:strand:+ start:302 stop:1261 length:960 start_codon:yes stop_codon:yes gene_type:complete